MSEPRYCTTQRAETHGEEIVLHDREAHTTAVVLPAAGFNCWRFTLHTDAGTAVEFLAGPADPKQLQTGGSGLGWPILFPFPNRIARGEFTFNGKTYRVPCPPRGHAIHGFVHVRPWRVKAMRADPKDGASVTAEISSETDEVLRERWPWPCKLTATYRLQGLSLIMSAAAENLGKEPMPFGFGVHPYHPLPLTPAGARGRCQIRIPCREQLELTPDCIPTGKRLPSPEWLQLRPLDDAYLDNVFTATQLDERGSACVLRDPDSKYEVTLHADHGFAHWVVYAPAKRSVICFEPYTCVTDAFNLHARGVTDTGFAVLEPGKPWRGTVTMRVARL